jgi:hypothetical protein
LTATGIRLGYVDGPEGRAYEWWRGRSISAPMASFWLRRWRHCQFSTNPQLRLLPRRHLCRVEIVLLLTTIFQVRFGLAPLKRISGSIADIRSGRAERLEGRISVEIAPLAPGPTP